MPDGWVKRDQLTQWHALASDWRGRSRADFFRGGVRADDEVRRRHRTLLGNSTKLYLVKQGSMLTMQVELPSNRELSEVCFEASLDLTKNVSPGVLLDTVERKQSDFVTSCILHGDDFASYSRGETEAPRRVILLFLRELSLNGDVGSLPSETTMIRGVHLLHFVRIKNADYHYQAVVYLIPRRFWKLVGNGLKRAYSKYLDYELRGEFPLEALRQMICWFERGTASGKFDFDCEEWHSFVKMVNTEVTREGGENGLLDGRIDEDVLMRAWARLPRCDRMRLMEEFERAEISDFRQLIFGERKPTRAAFKKWLLKADKDIENDDIPFVARAIQHFAKEWSLTLRAKDKRTGEWRSVNVSSEYRKDRGTYRFQVVACGALQERLSPTISLPILTSE